MKYTINNIINNLSDSTFESLDNNIIFTEGAVKQSKKHRLDNYLKKYGYNNETNIDIHGKTYKSGFITVNGKKYRIVKNYDKSQVIDYDHIPTIGLGKSFETLKNTQRMDSTLLHEIGHIKFNHSKTTDSKVGKDSTKNYAYDKMKDEFEKDDQITKDDKVILNNLIEEERKKNTHDESTFNDTEKLQKSNHDIYKQYEKYHHTNDPEEENKKASDDTINNEHEHQTRKEFEADRYAMVQQGTTKHLKAGLREEYKKEIKTIPSILKQAKKDTLKEFDKEDYYEIDSRYDKKRNKVLDRDKTITGKIFKKITPEKFKDKQKNDLSRIDEDRIKEKKEAHKENTSLVYNQSKKEYKEDKEKIAKAIHTANSRAREDMNTRAKAIRDKNIDDSIYREENHYRQNQDKNTQSTHKKEKLTKPDNLNNNLKTESVALFNELTDLLDL